MEIAIKIICIEKLTLVPTVMDGLVWKRQYVCVIAVKGKVGLVLGWHRQRANINFMFIYLFLCKK